MMRSYPLLIAVPLLLAYGVAEGLWTDRWVPSHDAEQAAARLQQVPRTVGGWEGHDQKLDPRQASAAALAGALVRRYIHRRSGARVTVVLVCGRPGPIAVHPPDVCYSGAGYELTAAPVRVALTHKKSAEPAPASGDFWVGQFVKTGPVPEPLRIYWSWSATGAWVAPDNPRVQFAGHGALYKLYVVQDLPLADVKPEEDPVREFISRFLPEVTRSLFPAEEQSATSS